MMESDLRIKPEVVARGVDVPVAGWDDENPNDNDKYYLVDGTSFSAPTASGAVALLQELYNNTYQEYMLAATVKALLCHTATDITKWIEKVSKIAFLLSYGVRYGYKIYLLRLLQKEPKMRNI